MPRKIVLDTGSEVHPTLDTTTFGNFFGKKIKVKEFGILERKKKDKNKTREI